MEKRTFIELINIIVEEHNSLSNHGLDMINRSKEGIQKTRSTRTYKDYMWLEYYHVYQAIMTNDKKLYTEWLNSAYGLIQKQISGEENSRQSKEVLIHNLNLLKKYINLDYSKTLKKNFDDIKFITVPKYVKPPR